MMCRTIPNTTLWVVLNVLEFGLSGREAVDAPRTHHPWFPDVLRLEGAVGDEEVVEVAGEAVGADSLDAEAAA